MFNQIRGKSFDFVRTKKKTVNTKLKTLRLYEPIPVIQMTDRVIRSAALLIVFAFNLDAEAQQATSRTATYRPVVGKRHVDFKLPRIDNREPLSLSDYRGKKVLLLHFASW